MRHIFAGAALVLLFAAAWSWGGNDATVHEPADVSILVQRLPCWGGIYADSLESLDADAIRLLSRWPVPRRDSGGDISVAGERVVVEATPKPVEEAVDENPYLEEATAYYGVEWAREALIIVRWRESSNRLSPCVTGLSGERGPYQFMLSTWATTPYMDQDPCDLEAATWAAAWKVSQPEGWRAWIATWPRE